MNRTATAFLLCLFLLPTALVSADTLELKDGEKHAGRILGVTDAELHIMVDTETSGIRVLRQFPIADVANLQYQRPTLEELQRQVRLLEKENKGLQESLDKAVDEIAQLRFSTEDMEQAMARMREKLDQFLASPSLRAQPTPQSSPDFWENPPSGPMDENPNTARVVAGDITVETSRTTGMTYIRGRILNTGRARARWIKVRVSGVDQNGNVTIQETGYSRRPILEPGESSPFSVGLSPPNDTVDFTVQPEWSD